MQSRRVAESEISFQRFLAELGTLKGTHGFAGCSRRLASTRWAFCKVSSYLADGTCRGKFSEPCGRAVRSREGLQSKQGAASMAAESSAWRWLKDCSSRKIREEMVWYAWNAIIDPDSAHRGQAACHRVVDASLNRPIGGKSLGTCGSSSAR